MNKLVRQMYFKSVIKIIFSIVIEILVIYITIQERMNITATIVIITIWTIISLIYFFNGIRILKNGTKNLIKYIENSNYTKYELNSEFEKSQKFGTIYVGQYHVFVVSSNGIHVFLITDIENISYEHLGANLAKGRNGYYYLYIKGKNIEDNVKIYFSSKTNLIKTINYLVYKNNKIEVNL